MNALNAKRNYTALIAVVILMAQAAIAGTQEGQELRQNRSRWSAARGQASNTITQTGGNISTAADRNKQEDDVELLADEDKSLVGTWFVDVPLGPDSFSAFHTFGPEGTFVETSSLLGQLFEGPAHGVWSGKKRDYALTFQVFSFGPDQSYAGRARVRCRIHIDNADQFTADYAVDIIDLDGTIIPEVAAGQFFGTRMRVVPR